MLAYFDVLGMNELGHDFIIYTSGHLPSPQISNGSVDIPCGGFQAKKVR